MAIRFWRALLCLVTFCFVHVDPMIADDVDKPVDRLLQAAKLDDAAVGYGAQRTAIYAAFAQLYSQGSAAEPDARRLIEHGTPAGRVYGYIVLRQAAPNVARSYGPTLLADHAAVEVLSGCLGEAHTVAELVQSLNEGRTVIQLPQELTPALAKSAEPAAAECPDE